ncbi:hypothetical protein [Achromobacter insolitus]|uniref:hypothetical protein n=1 Tax=Achromobacter insolitus TaxID=217204 RepID=UPI000F81F685|nr:hypothetical protein [Achromobacter insolitus]
MNSLTEARVVGSLGNITIDRNAPSVVCNFSENGWRFDYFFHGIGAKNLLVFFPSALVRGKRHVPSFHRWSWAKNFENADVICVSDPTLFLHQEMLGAWCQGKRDDWILPRTLAHILQLQQKFGYSRIVFCGSSLGGFLALQAGTLAPSLGFDAEKCRVFSENPQVSLPKYMWTSHMNRLAQVSFGVPTISDVEDKYLPQLDVVELIKKTNHIPKGLLVIKESDAHHYEAHVGYLQGGVSLDAENNLRVEVISAAVDSTGHTPLTFDEMSARVIPFFH